jgi:signal transduction histidine kinase
LLISGVFALLTFFFINNQKTRLIEAAINEKINFAKTISDTTSSLVWKFRITELPGAERIFFSQMAQFPDIVSLRLVNIDGTVRRSNVEAEIGKKFYDPDIASAIAENKVIKKDSFYRGQPVKLIIYPGTEDNVVWLSFSLAAAQKKVQEITVQIILMNVGILIILLSLLFFLLRLIIKPLQEIIAVLREIAKGNLKARVRIKSRTEIGEVAATINKMAENLETSREREKILSRLKSEFISIAAHRLRTPLSIIKWVLKMVISGDVGKLKKGQKDMLEKGYRANERMIALVANLLDVARIEEGKFGYQFHYAQLEDIIKEQLKHFDLLAKEKNISLIFRRPKQILPKIKMDPQKIALVLENLLENSLHYTNPKGSVEIKIERRDPFLEVIVKDTGIGIPKKQMNRLFTKFFRGENVVRMQTEGTGLGLFIVKNIVERHGGKIWAESKEGKGTTMHFTLPLKEEMIPKKETIIEEFKGL